ncbi:MAG TPA: phosphate acetyltransferase, partial [Solirubrobacteraceae bacterium]|nr:phosphate acetyltransferase [Solirubrobacteraceae bacterium]
HGVRRRPLRTHMAAQNIYITAMGPNSGKSVVALGFTEMLSARLRRIGFFRPIIRGLAEPDPQIELMRDRYQLPFDYAEMHGPTADEVTALIAHGAHEEIEKRVLVAYRELERRCDFVVCEGTDFVGATPALDFDLNANLANQLGCPVLVVINGAASVDVVEEVQLARELLQRKDCALFGVIVNRVAPDAVGEVEARLAPNTGEEWVYVMPEHAELGYVSVGEIQAALGARSLVGADGMLDRDVREVRVAAMSAEHFIDDLEDGTLVVVPADRSDIVVACLACTLSPTFPAVSGLLLTGGYQLSTTVRRLLETAPFPVLEIDARTHLAAAAISTVRPVLRAGNERKIATALGVFERSVDKLELQMRFMVERPARMTPTMFEYELIERAKAARRRIVLPEGEDDRVLQAADILLRRRVVALTVLGDPDVVRGRAAALGLDLDGAEIVDPLTSPERERYGAAYHELRKHKGLTEEVAYDALGDPTYFGTMMVHLGEVDGMVSGAAHTTGDTIRPAFEFVKARPGVSVVSSVFFMCLSDRVLVYGDCAVNPKPDSQQLADIAISSADTAAAFGVSPRIAMLSYATGDSAKGEQVDAVREATDIVRRQRGDLKVDGPIQYDAAVDASVAKLKMPDSEVAGSATVFIFPDLDTGNVAYKAVQRSSGAVAIGPVLQGLRKPVNDLSRGCAVTDVVNTVAITAIQAQEDG